MIEALVQQMLAGDRRSLARLLTIVENGGARAHQAIRHLYPHTGRAHLIGVTGAPGTGKSTLVNELAKAFRAAGQKVAILAVDPTSPFSGGAILGDRVRMTDLSGDQGIFVRSMATRGSSGGLARSSGDLVRVMDAAGFEVIMIETVGAGQSEVAIAAAAHSVVVVEAPGLGDEVQALKAGILEIADVFVVNKADRDGVDRAAASLAMMLDLGRGVESLRLLHHGLLMELMTSPAPTSQDERWRPPIIKTVATRGQGVPELVAALADHRDYLQASGEWAQRERVRLANELEYLLRDQLLQRLLADLDRGQLSQLLEQVAARKLDPYQAVRQLVERTPVP